MRILFFANGTKAAPWVDGLRSRFPQATVDEWSPGAPQADYAVVWSPPQQLLDEQPGLKAVFNTGAGVDALLRLRFPPDVPLVRLDDAGMSVQMAEFVCHAVIRHVRELDEYERRAREGNWAYRRPRLRTEYPVGVMGLGVLGARVARALQHFEFPVNGWSRSPRELDGVRCFAGDGGFDDFLAASRVLVCLVPLTPETEGILNRRTLGRLMPGAYLVNVARGAHLVEADLLELLASGQMAGATLDVLREEPPPADHPFRTHPGITLTPHTSARTLRDESIDQIAGKIRAMERGEPVAGMVDRTRGY